MIRMPAACARRNRGDTTFIGNQRSSPSGVANLYLVRDTQVIKEDAGFEGHFVRGDGLLEPDPFVSSIWLLARGESEIAPPDELNDLPPHKVVSGSSSRVSEPFRKLCRRLVSGHAPDSYSAGGQVRRNSPSWPRIVWVLPPPNWVIRVSTGAVLSVFPESLRSTMPACSRRALVKQVRAKNCFGTL